MKNKPLQRTIVFFLYCLPFSVFLFGLLGQSKECGGGLLPTLAGQNGTMFDTKSFFCIGKPDFLAHSLYYDILFLRGGVALFGSHWFSQLFFPLLFFLTIALTKYNYKFALIYSFFFLFFHESYWVVVKDIYGNYLALPDFVWIGIMSFGMVLAYLSYPRFFFRKEFALIAFLFIMFIVQWAVIDNMNVTVSANLPTRFYDSLITNAEEVGSWIFAFLLLLVYLIRNRDFLSKKSSKNTLLNLESINTTLP